MNKKVYYINVDEEVKFLSNFSKHSIKVMGKDYLTSEHFYQASKFFQTDPEWAEEIRNAKTPKKAKRMGNSKDHIINPDWDQGVSIFYMEKGLIAKVYQHTDVRDQLLNTEDAMIIERTDYDSIWGDGKDRKGKNQLGKIWMSVRKDFKIIKD